MSSHGSTASSFPGTAPPANSSNTAAATTKSTVAPPALNVYKKVPVIRKPSDSLTYEDAEGNIKSVSAQELGDAISHATPLSQPKIKLDIPVPRINNVESYLQEVSADYHRPRAYVRYHRLTDDEWKHNTLEYVADAEDEAWLLQKNAKYTSSSTGTSSATTTTTAASNSVGGGMAAATEGRTVATAASTTTPAPQLTIDLLERMMDALEKETAFDAIITVSQADALFRMKIPQFYHIFPSHHHHRSAAAAAQPHRQGHATAKHVLNDVYTYWVQKRSKLKRPLLRRFWPVTSTDDTNPHLVFRPREKEKYKLRKKRQNDMDAFRKMKQLRSDFDNLRAVLELVKKREELNRLHVQMQIDLFQQRLHNVIDTTGQPRESTVLHRSQVKDSLTLPSLFDMQGRRAKRPRPSTTPLNVPTTAGPSTAIASAVLPPPDGMPRSVAGQNHGQPAPHFLQPLYSRETYATSWHDAVPFVETYVDAQPQVTFRYRHRPRVGRGGRVCIDRVPQIQDNEEDNNTKLPPLTVYTAGKGLKPFKHPKRRLLDLLPRPLDHLTLSRRVEEICVLGIQQDYEARMLPPTNGGEPDENDADEVIVKTADWNDTDGQLWGEERYVIGPFEE